MKPAGRKSVRIRDRSELSRLGKVTPAYLLELTLENFRCFKGENRLLFTDKNGHPARWTVVIGCNGTGKTTLLEAIASVYPRTVASRTEGKDGINWGYEPAIFDEPVRTFFRESHVNGCDVRVAAEFQTEGFGVKSKRQLRSHIEFIGPTGIDTYFKSATRESGFKMLSISGIAGDGRSMAAVFGASGKHYENEYLSLIAGYGAHRLAGISDRVALAGKNVSSIDSLFSPFAPLTNAEEWLLQADYVSRLKKKTTRSRKPFEAIKDSLRRIIPSVSEIHIDMNNETKKPEVLFETIFGKFPLQNLSFGYQVTISWIIDLASRLMEHYPDSHDFLDEPAVVLVDEIDLHLHPSWQRTLMDNLSKIFTQTQFIVTAHSPLIVQSAPDANLILLKVEEDRVVIDNDPVSIDAWRVDQILTSELFGLPSARSIKLERLLKERREIMTKPKLIARDKERLKGIERQIGELPTAEKREDQEALDIIREGAAYFKSLNQKN